MLTFYKLLKRALEVIWKVTFVNSSLPFIFNVWIDSFIIKIISCFIVVNNCQCFLILLNFRNSHHASVMILIIIHHTLIESLINTRAKKQDITNDRVWFTNCSGVIKLFIILHSTQSEGHTNASCIYSYQFFHPSSLTSS